MTQRDISFTSLTATRASGAVVWIRLYVGLIFVGEGFLKFLRPDALGPGRFAKVDIPFSTFTAYLDGVFEIGCGAAILVGLLVRLATLPMIIDMIGALAFTKVPLLFGSAALYPRNTASWTSFTKAGWRSRCCAAASSCSSSVRAATRSTVE